MVFKSFTGSQNLEERKSIAVSWLAGWHLMATRDSVSEWNAEAVKTVWQSENGGVLTMGSTVN